MSRVEPGRITHEHSGELVVFLVGMRINKWWRFRSWWPVFTAMPGMLAELSKDPESGMLGFRGVLASGGPLIITYWDSHEKLYAYAGSRDAAHRPAWAAFNQRARRAPGVVGIYHETYQVSVAESMYVGTPIQGLAKATKAVPVGRRADRAVDRYRDGATVAAGAAPLPD